MKKRNFGKNQKGESVTMYSFENTNGMVMEVSNFGATLHSLFVPDKNGVLRDVVLGYDDLSRYENPKGTFFGATIGRNANRIQKGQFELNGKKYQLEINDQKNNLHSGCDSYSFRVWNVKVITENSITFFLHSPDGDQGYPGAVDIYVRYVLTDENEVRIDYCAVPEEDTILNFTNHSYFNLNGHDSGDVLEQEAWIDSDAFTPTDVELIPTGEIVSVEGTPMDFRVSKKLGKDIGVDYEALKLGNGYDHNFALNNNGKLEKVAGLYSDESGIKMEVYTDLPGVQLYTGNFINNELGKNGVIYQQRQGVCFETQYFPDAMNHDNFCSPIFRKGDEYKTTTIYKFI